MKKECLCWFCFSPLRWNSDSSFEDYCMDGDGIVANLSCSECGATAEFYTAIEEDK